MRRASQFGSKIVSSLSGLALASSRSPARSTIKSKTPKSKRRNLPPISSIEISESSSYGSTSSDFYDKHSDDEDDHDSYSSEVFSKQKKKKSKRRKGRKTYSSSSRSDSGSSSGSSYESDISLDMLSRKDLFQLKTKQLKQKCRRDGIDINTRNISSKKDLVKLIYNYYHPKHDKRGSSTSPDKNSYPYRHPTSKYDSINDYNNEVETDVVEVDQMVAVLREILPFYGEGDVSSDNTVRDTIRRLPSYALDTRDEYGNTVLLLACQYGAHAYELVKIMVSKGCNVNAQNFRGVCGLHNACYTDSLCPDTVRVLTEHGGYAEVQEAEFGCTPLHWAAFAGLTDLCSLLCEAGALPTTLDKNGCDPIQYAKQARQTDCAQFLVGIKESLKNNQNKNGVSPSWNKLMDQNTGLSYYYNFKTGVSIWEDEFDNQNYRQILKPISKEADPVTIHEKDREKIEESSVHLFDEESSQISVASEKNAHKDKAINPLDKLDKENEEEKSKKSLKVIIPTRAQMLSPMVFSPCEPTSIPAFPKSKAMPPTKVSTPGVSKETFEERFVALQQKMEQQLMDQLNTIETRINAPVVKTVAKSPSLSLEAQKSLSEMGAKIIQLQTEIGTKDMEIISLKRDIIAMETKLVNQSTTSPVPKLPNLSSVKDAMVGDGDVMGEDCVPSSSLSQVQETLAMKLVKLNELTSENIEIKSNIHKLERQLALSTDKCQSLEEQLFTGEAALETEKASKDELMLLLNQAREGIEVESKMSASILEEKERVAEFISSLREKCKFTEEKASRDITGLSNQIDKLKTDLLTEGSKVHSLSEQIELQHKGLLSEQSKVSYVQAKLDSSYKDHQEEKQKLTEEYKKQADDELNKLAKAHNCEMEILQSSLKEEKLLRLEKELERNEAKQAMEKSMEKCFAAEMELKDMKQMVTDAKKIIRVNEQLHKALHVETDRRKTLHNRLEDLKGKIRVYVRVRPLSASEQEKNSNNVLIKEDERTCVMLADTENGLESKAWEFDHIFCGGLANYNTQEAVFKDTKRLITSAVDGFNVCIFAYGQTGSGKTYTMFGSGGIGGRDHDEALIDESTGLAPRSAAELFRVLQEREASNEINIDVTMFELYNDGLRDLLVNTGKSDGQALKIKLAEHSHTGMVEVDGATNERVESIEQLLSLFKRGANSRTTSSTQMNADSSRSHLITCIVTTLTNKRSRNSVRGKLTLVDLAGSEKVAKSGAEGQQLKEAQSINKSLSALGDVISSLTSGSKHIPYRNHPLTMLMSDSIGGSAKTLMFVCCSPSDYNRSESINSLDFAKRCKNVTNVVNRKGNHVSQVRALKLELARMKKEKGGSSKKKLGVIKRPGM